VLMFMFLSLVLDRVLYLTRWNEGKSYLQVLEVGSYHFMLLWVYQMQSGNDTIQILYLFKALYFGLSACQIRDKYPMYTQGEYLTRTEDGQEPSVLQYYLYNLYRGCPFLFELRVLLDWACCRTSLDFYQWFKLEDIFGQLFITKCTISQRHKAHELGGAQTIATKMLVGVGTFVALCVLLWLPLILFSNGSALMVPNPVTAASLHVSLSDGFRNYRLYSVDNGLARQMEMDDLRQMNRQKIIEPYFDKTGTQIIRFPKTSDTVFTAPQPLVNDLISRLSNDNHTVSFHVQAVWERNLPINNKEVTVSFVKELSSDKKTELANVMNTVLSSENSVAASFSVNQIVPDVVQLPAMSIPSVLSPFKHNLLFTFNHQKVPGAGFEQWWDIQYVTPGHPPAPIEMFAVSAQVLGSYMGIGSYISQLGVVGFYVSVVFVVGRLIRGFVGNLQARVMFEDMEDVSVPMYLCKNIHLARQEAGTSLDDTDHSVSKALMLEDRLYWELIRLYRQPEKLFRYTTIRVAPSSPRSSNRD